MEILGIVVQVLTAGAIVFAAWQLLFHSRAMHREFEMLYVERYWHLMDRRSEQFALTQKPTEADRQVIRAYLNLCEDEADLRGLGRVTDNTWKFWSSAIVEQLSVDAYRAELESLDEASFPRVRELLSTKGKRDPLNRRWLNRKVHGL